MSEPKKWEPTPEKIKDIRQGLKEIESRQRLTLDEVMQHLEENQTTPDGNSPKAPVP